nr:alpha-amylase 3, chloroplastic isoform X2 [Ipomoea batatas]
MDHNQDAHRQRIVDWINATNGTVGAFDVTTKGILHAAGCKGGKMQGGCELYGGKLGTGECKGGGRWADDCLFGGMDMRLGSLYQVRLREVG